jgi:hypothetical protein
MNLLLGIAIMVLCLILQALLIVAVIRYYASQLHRVRSPSLLSSIAVMVGVMLLLLAGNFAQIGIWALAFRLIGEFPTYAEALYHSTVNFATLGYGDIVMSKERRILGPLEAINGALMIGVSTAVLMTAFQDAIRRTAAARGASF